MDISRMIELEDLKVQKKELDVQESNLMQKFKELSGPATKKAVNDAVNDFKNYFSDKFTIKSDSTSITATYIDFSITLKIPSAEKPSFELSSSNAEFDYTIAIKYIEFQPPVLSSFSSSGKDKTEADIALIKQQIEQKKKSIDYLDTTTKNFSNLHVGFRIIKDKGKRFVSDIYVSMHDLLKLNLSR